jgi:hypothetical protein
MPHLFRDGSNNARGARWFHLVGNPCFLATITARFGLISLENRQIDPVDTRYKAQKTKRTGPGEPGPMRFQQGLLPCQFIVRCWLPVF